MIGPKFWPKRPASVKILRTNPRSCASNISATTAGATAWVNEPASPPRKRSTITVVMEEEKNSAPVSKTKAPKVEMYSSRRPYTSLNGDSTRAPTANPRTKAEVVIKATTWLMLNSVFKSRVPVSHVSRLFSESNTKKSPCENPDEAMDTIKHAKARIIAFIHFFPLPKFNGFSTSPSSHCTRN